MSDSFQDIQLRKYRQTLYRSRNNVLMLVVLLLFAILISLLAGRYPQPGIAMAEAITGDPMMLSIIRDLRLPRVLLAIFGGAMLACAGFVFQLLFANPLVEPGFLGVSQGASFGAA
ncbi:MAG: iron ABC transporter permease, partial [Sphaerochaetaceae bacterium]|nr:iron ABC transporter permease [Sphaerochaetaceae bacterium]